MKNHKKLKIAYLSGPVNAFEVYDSWCSKEKTGYFGTSYLSQFFEVCNELDADGYVITILPGKYENTKKGRFYLENRPVSEGLKGIFYHLNMVLWYIRLIPRLVFYKPDVIILTAHINYWFLLFFLRWLGVIIIPSIHCVIWHKFNSPPGYWKFLLYLNKLLIFSQSSAFLAVSQDICEQISSLLKNGKKNNIYRFLPTYSREQFSSIQPPSFEEALPFRILFAGRLERNKGIYDLVDIAKKLESLRQGKFRFDICGVGSELDNLNDYIRKENMEKIVFCHGACDIPTLTLFFQKCHAVIVPTTTAFEEGFNKVCAEAVLMKKPVITSAVCPALADIYEAAIEVKPDCIDEYCQAIIKLSEDREFYEHKRNACVQFQDQFYDERNSWGAKLKEALQKRLGNLGNTKQ
jgi:glycosyltransferase involved in cell wall biosynthesis